MHSVEKWFYFAFISYFRPFHPKDTHPEKWLLDAAATSIQRHVRGWLVRRKLARLKRKSKLHGGSWNNLICCYKDLILKIQRRLGIERPKFYFSFDIIDNFMDTKKRKHYSWEIIVSVISALK